MGFDLPGFLMPLKDASVQQALWLTVRLALATLVLHLIAGLTLGFCLSKPQWPGREVLDLLVTVPLVFPPMATGFLLLLLLGRRGVIGEPLREWFGVDVVFSFWGLLLGAFIAGVPLVVKPVQAALEGVAHRQAEAARTLGKNEVEIFWFVLLPAIRGALVAGLILGMGRALGEVGITLMLGGNITSRTVTASLDIYNSVLAGDYERAGAVSLVLGAVTILLFMALRQRPHSARQYL